MKINKLFMVAAVVVGALLVGARANAQSPPPGVADIKMLAKGGISDEVILSQIRNSHAVYHLSTADILDLKDAGASQKVIDFMINTGGDSAPPPPPHPVVVTPPSVSSPAPPPPSPVVVREAADGAEPPPVIIEDVAPAPGPEYAWVAGSWIWRHHHWEWVGGRWVVPPHRGAVWVEGRWDRRGGRAIWIEGSWR
ncbi:MAG: YXWGXW repeat-containing protein [Bryobacteraceae bacterium]